MNWEQISGNWKQFKGKVKEQWGKLTDDEPHEHLEIIFVGIQMFVHFFIVEAGGLSDTLLECGGPCTMTS